MMREGGHDRWIGGLVVAGSLAVNHWSLGFLLSPDGRIESLVSLSVIWLSQLAGLAIGTVVLLGRVRLPLGNRLQLAFIAAIALGSGLATWADLRVLGIVDGFTRARRDAPVAASARAEWAGPCALVGLGLRRLARRLLRVSAWGDP